MVGFAVAGLVYRILTSTTYVGKHSFNRLDSRTREPKPAEVEAMTGYLRRARDRRSAWEDVVWALLNSKEFLLRH